MRGKSRPTPQMNVTPLVDVVLVLLIIFMVVIPAMQHGVALELPSIFNPDSEARGRTDPIELTIARNGDLYVERVYMPRAQAEARLATIHAATPTRRVVLRADRGVSYGKARELFAVCQQLGFPGVSLQVNARARPGATPPTNASAETVAPTTAATEVSLGEGEPMLAANGSGRGN